MFQILTLALLISLLVTSVNGQEKPRGVAYDGRSLIVNGNRELFFSGSIHYTRSPPEVTLNCNSSYFHIMFNHG